VQSEYYYLLTVKEYDIWWVDRLRIFVSTRNVCLKVGNYEVFRRSREAWRLCMTDKFNTDSINEKVKFTHEGLKGE